MGSQHNVIRLLTQLAEQYQSLTRRPSSESGHDYIWVRNDGEIESVRLPRMRRPRHAVTTLPAPGERWVVGIVPRRRHLSVKSEAARVAELAVKACRGELEINRTKAVKPSAVDWIQVAARADPVAGVTLCQRVGPVIVIVLHEGDDRAEIVNGLLLDRTPEHPGARAIRMGSGVVPALFEYLREERHVVREPRPRGPARAQ